MTPIHVTIIMDGNGRWAENRGKTRIFGHKNALTSVRECCEFAAREGIKYLSLFAFSEENWNRPDDEIGELMRLFSKSISGEREVFMRNNIKFRVIGNVDRLDDDLRKAIRSLETETESNDGMVLLLMVSYSGRWDILQAVNRYASDIRTNPSLYEQPISAEGFEQYLATYGIPDPDLMIRTSGEQRISNYMLWQCSYTEFYFTDVLWPDFRKDDFRKALDSFEKRDRRYGKIK